MAWYVWTILGIVVLAVLIIVAAIIFGRWYDKNFIPCKGGY